MYDKMFDVYRKNPAVFPIATAYLVDKGFTFVSQITDEDVEGLEGNGLMTKEFVQELVQLARKIVAASDNNAVEIIQFCAAEGIFDTEYYKGFYEDEEMLDD